jgi:hypothetical protein
MAAFEAETMMTDQERAKALLMNRTEGVSIRRIIRKSARHYVLSILVTLGFLTIAFIQDSRIKYFYMVAFGMSCGVLLRDVASLHRSKKDWGFWSHIMDWKKIEKIAEGERLANQSSEPSAGNADEPLSQLSTQSLRIPPVSPTLPQLLVAGLGFVPVLGLPFSLLSIAWGVSERQRLGGKLVILGIAGPMVSIAVLIGHAWLIILMIYNHSIYGSSQNSLAIWLTSAGTVIETFHRSTGRYPEKLSEMAESGIYQVFYDPSQPGQVVGGWTKQKTFYYQRLSNPSGYYLFSVGEDGKAFTPDDVLPAKSKELPGLRLPNK